MNYYRQGPSRPAGPGVPFGVPTLTPMVKTLIVACVAVWLLQLVVGDLLIAWFGVTPRMVLGGALWQPLTYMFLHSGHDPFHLFFNMLMLWMFGGELERIWGSRGFLTFYVVCGAGGGVCAVLLGALTGQGAAVPTIGASGAIFGLFVAYGMIFAERTILFMMMFPMKARTMVMIMVALNFFYLLSTPGSRVSHVAHLGGALTGFLYLKRAWRLGEFYREMRWKMKRRKFRAIEPEDPNDRWLN